MSGVARSVFGGHSSTAAGGDPAASYRRVRAATLAICAPLEVEDHGIQTMAEVSPPKWHLAHTSWFFETFVLRRLVPGYRVFDPSFEYLFNSYYNAVGRQFPRPQRGLLARPTLATVLDYRGHVDTAMERLLAEGDTGSNTAWQIVELGLHHEQQHQELLYTDIKHIFAASPLAPAYDAGLPAPPSRDPGPLRWIERPQGRVMIGHAGGGFAFDNELPVHGVELLPHAIASRPVTNAEYQAFIEDGGYRRAELWLSDGWAESRRQDWSAPLYWRRQDGEWWEFTLAGLRPLDSNAPVCHLSFYEADAYARWAGARLPREEEWEALAQGVPVGGNLADGGLLQPGAAAEAGVEGAVQLFGDVWEWTASAYGPYPGYRAAPGAFGEYNGKFMCNQLVLRGGSCVTPAGHVRASYRNFFYPRDRWQFSGIRLARDLS